jgi:alpha-tubulin suppressor-like RCC1 family protein
MSPLSVDQIYRRKGKTLFLLLCLSLSYPISQAGTVVAWGLNDRGQTNVPTDLANAVAIAAGPECSLALKADGTIALWGRPSLVSLRTVPPSATNVVAISAGGEHNLALRDDGRVIAWGSNADQRSTVPPTLTNAVAVAAGGQHSLALKPDGTVVGWGNNFFGQSRPPVGLRDVVAIAAGDLHSLALRRDGTVAAWGDNNFGTTNVPPGLEQVVAISAGFNHSLAVRRDGSLAGWGWNSFGQTNVPSGLGPIRNGSSGYKQVLALGSDGTVTAWGTDTSAVQVPAGLSNVQAVAAGMQHSLALVGPPPTAPELLLEQSQPGGVHVGFAVDRGTRSVLESTDVLDGVSWQMLLSTPGDGTLRWLTDPVPSSNQRFYRIRIQ